MGISRPIIILTLLIALATSISLNVYILTRHPVFFEEVIEKAIRLVVRRPNGSAIFSPNMGTSDIGTYHAFLGLKVEPIMPVEAEEANVLPDKLIIPKGIYRYGDKVYDLDKEGLYRFITPPIENKQRIVYSGDIDRLISSIAWIAGHGKRDNGRSYYEITEIAKRSKVILTCGRVTSWTKYILDVQGIKSRIAAPQSSVKHGHYYDKHAFIEVYNDSINRWVLYDIDNNIWFKRGDVPMSFDDFKKYTKTDDYTIGYIANDFNLDIGGFNTRAAAFDYAPFFEGLMRSEAYLRQWYKRMTDGESD